MTRWAMVWPAAAKPYPGELPVPAGPVSGPGPALVDPPVRAGAHGCTGLRKAGQPCNGNAGADGRCARHKAR